MKQKLLFSGAIAILLFSLSSCYEYSDVDYLDELDVTYTSYDNTYDFQTKKTIALRDSVALVENHWDESEIDAFYAAGGGSEKIRTLITEKFEAIGYTVYPQDSIKMADLAINPILYHIKNSGTVWYPPMYPGWGWGYWPYYGYSTGSYYPGYPGWGWGGYYPWYGYNYTYKTGTLSLEMADGASLQAFNEEIQGMTAEEIEDKKDELTDFVLVWKAAVDGYISSDMEYNTARAERGLEEAIAQSPYLNLND